MLQLGLAVSTRTAARPSPLAQPLVCSDAARRVWRPHLTACQALCPRPAPPSKSHAACASARRTSP
eukprot:888561-Prymnesium_polylepis.1